MEPHDFGNPIIGVGTRDLGQVRVDCPWEEVVARAGADRRGLAAMRRDDMMRTMGEGVVLPDLYVCNALICVFAVGGNQ